MQSLRVTLYEIFGYAAPGILFLCALGIAAWSLYFPSTPLPLVIPTYNIVVISIVLFFAYLAGHMVQAVGNFLTPAEKRKSLCVACKSLEVAAKEVIHRKFGLKTELLPFRDLVTTCVSILSQGVNQADYEVFVYREGFYRGTSVSSVLCAAALVGRTYRPCSIQLNSHIVFVPKSLLATLASLSLIASVLFYRRYLRFGDYRIRHLLGVISVLSDTANSNMIQEKEN